MYIIVLPNKLNQLINVLLTDHRSLCPATRSLLIVCPRVPPIMRYLGTDQATLNLSCQTGCLTQFTELRQGELIPGLYARVEVRSRNELPFIVGVASHEYIEQ